MGRHRIAAAGLAMVAAVVAEPAAAVSFESLFATRWQWSEGVDHITDQKVSRAVLLTVTIEDVQLGLAEARIVLTCTGGKPVMDFDWSFKAAGKGGLTVEYRFANLAGRSLKARYVNRTRQEVSDRDGIRQFLADAQRSDSLRLRLTSDLYGVTEATFKAAAGADMVRRFVAACPVVAPR